jgi:hypothetical protein
MNVRCAGVRMLDAVSTEIEGPDEYGVGINRDVAGRGN